MKQVKTLKVTIAVLMMVIIVLSGWMVADILITANNLDEKTDMPYAEKVELEEEDLIANSGNKVQAVNDQAKTSVFSKASLKAYDGLVNDQVYIAVEGLVYDVSALGDWIDGEHQGIKAGKDLTVEFAQSPHSISILDEALIVGTYLEVLEEELPSLEVAGLEVDEVSTHEKASITGDLTSAKATKEFTKESLRAYNGIEKKDIYIAVNNIVYDVSTIDTWKDGEHQGIRAGQDLTEAFAKSPHSQEILNQARVVGTYVEALVQTALASESQPTANDKDAIGDAEVEPLTQSKATTKTTSQGARTFNQSSLSVYNGSDNPNVYIAVNGLVYDVTSIGTWRDGEHQGIKGGSDVTSAFENSPHSQSILDQAKVVGTYIAEQNTVEASVEEGTTELWTYELLGLYNGSNGYPTYIAVGGIIYDISSISEWSGGTHEGYEAGQDLTAAFAQSPHSQSLLSQLPMVGEISQPLQNQDQISGSILYNISDDGHEDYDESNHEAYDHDSEDEDEEDEEDEEDDYDEEEDHDDD